MGDGSIVEPVGMRARGGSGMGLRVALLGLLLLGFGLRVLLLDAQELRGDEAFGYFFSQRTYSDIVDATIALKEPHPVASYFVAKAWLRWAGDSEYALRFLGVWWGVLAAALIYRLARRLGFGGWPSALAALLVAISPYAIWHSQDARMYAMSLALTTATVLLAVEALQRQRWSWAFAYIGVAWLALQTHYYAFFVLLALNLFVIGRAIFVPRTRATLVRWLLWQVIVAALYLPWFVRAGFILANYGGNGDSPGIVDALVRSFSVFAVGESTPPDQRAWWALAGALLLASGGVRLALAGANGRRNLALLLLYLAVPLAAMWYSAQSRPIFNERYLVTALPPFYLLWAAAFDRPRFRRTAELAVDGISGLLLALLIGGMLLALGRHYTDPAYSKNRGWRELAASISRLSAGLAPVHVRVAQNFPDPTLWYYYRGPVEHVVLPPAAKDSAGAAQSVDQLAQQGVQRVILPVQPAPNWDDAGLAAQSLGARYDPVARLQVGVWPVEVYAQVPGALQQVNQVFADGVKLQGAVINPTGLAPGGLLTAHLAWQGDTRKLTGAEKVTVQLLDAGGQLVAQDDRPLAIIARGGQGTGLESHGILLPDQLDHGPYRLIVGLYDAGRPGAPRIATQQGTDAVTLAEFP